MSAAREASRNRSSDWHRAAMARVSFFVLIVRGVKRVENDDLGGGGLRSGEEVTHALRGTEQMASGAGIDQQILIPAAVPMALRIAGQAVDELRHREVRTPADQNPARSQDGEAGVSRTGGQR